MTSFDFRELQERARRVTWIVHTADAQSSNYRLRKLCVRAYAVVDELVAELTSIDLRRVFAPWELWGLEKLVDELRGIGQEATEFVRCEGSQKMHACYLQRLDELHEELQRVWPRQGALV